MSTFHQGVHFPFFFLFRFLINEKRVCIHTVQSFQQTVLTTCRTSGLRVSKIYKWTREGRDASQ